MHATRNDGKVPRTGGPGRLGLRPGLAVLALAAAWSLAAPRLQAGTPAARAEEGAGGPLTVWFTAPAKTWNQALPIGNGRLGGMVFGGPAGEHVQFNEDSLWIGDEADTGSYQAFGDLYVDLAGQENVRDYRRTLDLRRAVHTVTYTSGGVRYRREAFASHPAQVMVLRLTADGKGAYTGAVRLADAHKGRVTAEGNRLTLTGSLEGYTYRNAKKKYAIALAYEAQVLVLAEGGKVRAEGDRIAFEGADALTVLLAADTDYLNRRQKGWRGEHPHRRLTEQLAAAAAKPYAALLEEHVRDHRRLFDRFALDLGRTPEAARRLPTPERLRRYREGEADPDLEELLLQYARYLMIASSRPGALPANLQGLWNASNNPPWRSDYHTDVNVQMNYWFVDPTNLSECFEPFAEWLWSIREVRTEETKKAFGVRGWTMHAENGVFGGSTWRWIKPTAAWCAQNLWDHYAFTRDEAFLRRRAYPIMKELCDFWVDTLKALPDGTLVSPNGYSPEHGPVQDGVAHDQQLVWDLFTNFIEASEILGTDAAYRAKIAAMRGKLLGPQVGRWGQLQEWMEDIDNPHDKHRHLSHMIAVYPGRQIAPRTTPKWAEAAKVSLNARGDGGTGWSRVWKVCLWARLLDGQRAYRILGDFIRAHIGENLFDHIGGPRSAFQIDANFGYAAGVCEMLLQSHLGEVHLLPALPTAWPTGEVRGIRARGAFELDIAWDGGKLVRAVLRSEKGGPCRVRAAVPLTVTEAGRPVQTKAEGPQVIAFETRPGATYVLTPRAE